MYAAFRAVLRRYKQPEAGKLLKKRPASENNVSSARNQCLKERCAVYTMATCGVASLQAMMTS